MTNLLGFVFDPLVGIFGKWWRFSFTLWKTILFLIQNRSFWMFCFRIFLWFWIFFVYDSYGDAFPNYLMGSTANPKVKTTEGEGVGAHSLAHSTLGVKGRARAPRWGLGEVTSKLITHMDLHKPNNKLVNT
jgi:hypothetical protein